MERWRHDTSLDNTLPDHHHPHRPRHTSPETQVPPPPRKNANQKRYHEDSYSSFLPEHEQPRRSESSRFFKDLFDDSPPPADRTGREQSHQPYQGLNHSFFNSTLATSSDSSTDMSNITILPQLLGIGPNGQLVLVPLAASFNAQMNTSFAGQFPNGNQRISPVGRNSDSFNQTLNDDGGKSSRPSEEARKAKEKQEHDRLMQIEKVRLREDEKRKQEEKVEVQIQEQKQQEEFEKLQRAQRQHQQEQERLRQQKLLKSPAISPSPSLKKQKSPLFSRLKNIAGFSPSSKRESKESARTESPVEEKIVEQAVDVSVQESPADGPLSFDSEEDEEDLRLHTKQMSRAISDIEELSENDLVDSPKKTESQTLKRKSDSYNVSKEESPIVSRSRADSYQRSSIGESPSFATKNREDSSLRQRSSTGNSPSFATKDREDSSLRQRSSIGESPSFATKNRDDSSIRSRAKVDSPQVPKIVTSSPERDATENTISQHDPTSKGSMFSDFSDHSDFDLPSNKAKSNNNKHSDESHTISDLTPPPPAPAPKHSPSIGTTNTTRERAESQESQGDLVWNDFPSLMYIMEVLTEKVKDEESEEVLVLNIDINVNQANTIIG